MESRIIVIKRIEIMSSKKKNLPNSLLVRLSLARARGLSSWLQRSLKQHSSRECSDDGGGPADPGEFWQRDNASSSLEIIIDNMSFIEDRKRLIYVDS